METQWIDHPSGYLALSSRNSFFAGDRLAAPPRPTPPASDPSSPDDGFIAYSPCLDSDDAVWMLRKAQELLEQEEPPKEEVVG